MPTPPLLSERPRWVRIALVAIVPALYGALTGYFLGTSEGVYLVLSLLAAIGGIGAGYDHPNGGEGARRGLLGGAIFGAFVLIAHEIHGADAKADVPDPAVVLVLVTAVLGALLGLLGGWLRSRSPADRPAD
jgi:hypothetical protein